jgi:hypothetical protein
MVKKRRKKVLAVATAISLLLANSAVNKNIEPACLPDDQTIKFEQEAEEDNSKVKRRKGYFA